MEFPMPEVLSDDMVAEVLRLDRDLQEAANERRAALCVPYICAIPERLRPALLPIWEGREEGERGSIGSPKFYERVLAPLAGNPRFASFDVPISLFGDPSSVLIQHDFDEMLKNWKDPNIGVTVNRFGALPTYDIHIKYCKHPSPFGDGRRCLACNRLLK